MDVKARNLGPEFYEVVLTINATARAQGETVFLVELAYGCVVTVKNATAEMLPALILVETPRIAFPFARAIIANATRDCCPTTIFPDPRNRHRHHLSATLLDGLAGTAGPGAVAIARAAVSECWL